MDTDDAVSIFMHNYVCIKATQPYEDEGEHGEDLAIVDGATRVPGKTQAKLTRRITGCFGARRFIDTAINIKR